MSGMQKGFFGAFHEETKRQWPPKSPIPFDSQLWPDEWKIIRYKTYERMEKIPLSHGLVEADLFALIKNRRSKRGFTRSPLRKEQLSILLSYGCGLHGTHRAQPSAGKRYPLEVYPLVVISDDVAPGMYHYDVREHRLDVLSQKNVSSEDLSRLFTYPWAGDISLAIFVTAVFERNFVKYGDRGYRQILLEAGHVGQNLYLVAESLQLQCTAMDGFIDREVEKFLDIDGVTESVVYSMVFG